MRHTDRSTLRSILLHTLFYYNCPEKVDSVMTKIISTTKKDDKKVEHIEGEHYSESCESVSDEATAVKTLQALDDATFSIHFVLQQLKPGCSISDLFKNSDYDPEEESRRVRLIIYDVLKLYTKALEDVKEGDLRNHISYWLLISTLIEQQLIEDIDQDYIELMEDMGETPESFFLFESSLKLLCKYLRKLATWYNESIYLFYFQLLNLYYSYDVDRTLAQIQLSFAEKLDIVESI